MTPEGRLALLYEAMTALGLPCLVMGGHAVRFHGVLRATVDFDFHLALDPQAWGLLPQTLRRSALFANSPLVEGPSWRPDDFRRFIIGTLPDGREERLEVWRRNHLLAPVAELLARRAEGLYGGRTVAFLGIADLIRSKETERADDWQDVALLEEIADERNLARAASAETAIEALASLRSLRGFERAKASWLLAGGDPARAALSRCRHSIPAAFLRPFAPDAPLPLVPRVAPAARTILERALNAVKPGSPRHLALVEAVRRLYRQVCMAEDRADKEAAQKRQ